MDQMTDSVWDLFYLRCFGVETSSKFNSLNSISLTRKLNIRVCLACVFSVYKAWFLVSNLHEKKKKKNVKIRCVDSGGGEKLTGENSPINIASKVTTKYPVV